MAATKRLRPVGHEDRLSLIEHLDELRSRLMTCAVVLVIAFGFSLWQQNNLLQILNVPLEGATNTNGKGALEENSKFQRQTKIALQSTAASLNAIAATQEASPERARLQASIAALEKAVDAMPKAAAKRQPVTLGVSEPFTTSLTVALSFAVLLSLPIILWQLYAFILPAFTPRERQIAIPLMAMIPFLFVAGVVFAYFLVLPPAIKFLQGYNNGSFDILVQAKDYYKFELLTMISLGLLFQMPVGILAATKLGIITPRQLRKNRRYAIVVIAVIAMLLPGTDPITMLISMVPLLVLFEGSILLAAWVDRRDRKRARARGETEDIDVEPNEDDADSDESPG
jgi:sec-independent protein translocase protein TatC